MLRSNRIAEADKLNECRLTFRLFAVIPALTLSSAIALAETQAPDTSSHATNPGDSRANPRHHSQNIGEIRDHSRPRSSR